MITLTEELDVFPLFQHGGVEFIYVMAGEADFRRCPLMAINGPSTGYGIMTALGR